MKLVVFSKSCLYYTLYKYDLEQDAFELNVTTKEFEDLVQYVTKDCLISFENNDIELSMKIINFFGEEKIIQMKNSFGRSVKGVRFSEIIKNYGYDSMVINSIKTASNICTYLILKNKSI